MKLLVSSNGLCEAAFVAFDKPEYSFIDIMDVKKFDYVLPDVIGYNGTPTLVDNTGLCHYGLTNMIKVANDAR